MRKQNKNKLNYIKHTLHDHSMYQQLEGEIVCGHKTRKHSFESAPST